MILHLLHHELRRHRVLYPVAALLIFVLPLLTARLGKVFPADVGEFGATLIPIMAALGWLAVHLLLRGHRWHDDSAFWRTRPITARQMLASQSLAIGLVVLLPFVASRLLAVVPLHLGFWPAALAIGLPLGVAVSFVVALAACAALRLAGKRPDVLPYLAAFVVPLLSAAVFGIMKANFLSPWSGRPGDGDILSVVLLLVAVAVAGALAAFLLATLRRRRREAIGLLAVVGAALPWIANGVSFDLFRQDAPPARPISYDGLAGDGAAVRPRWKGLAPGEFFAPRLIQARMQDDGPMETSVWPRHSFGRHYSHFTRYQQDLLQAARHARSFDGDQNVHFAAAADVPALWADIRARLPIDDSWQFRNPNPSRHTPFHDPLTLASQPDRDGSRLRAEGVIFRFEALAPVDRIAPVHVPTPSPGRLEILRTAAGDSQIVVLLRHTLPNPEVFAEPSDAFGVSTAPPEFWAVLLHRPSSTAYACHGLVGDDRISSPVSMVTTRRHHLLSFPLPRLETRLLGMDPQKLLAESELHLFQAIPVDRATVPGTGREGASP